MDKINFLAKDSFPASTNTFNDMQNNIFLVSKLASIAGQNYILSGCVDNGETISDGVIVINGELLPFVGGIKKEKITIIERKEADHFNGVDYPEAYIYRRVEFSTKGEFKYSDFSHILTNKEIEDIISKISGDTVGTVKDWAGSTAKIPKNYMLCEGQDLLITDFPELFDMIKYSFGGSEGVTFKLPDCRGRFSVGYDNSKDDYKAIGNKGGAENVILTTEQIPEHQHIVPWGENLNTSWIPEWGYPDNYFNDHRGYKADTDNDNTWPFTSPVGKNKPHENRPPYIVFAKIIKVK